MMGNHKKLNVAVDVPQFYSISKGQSKDFTHKTKAKAGILRPQAKAKTKHNKDSGAISGFVDSVTATRTTVRYEIDRPS